jgi:hypothetical protein
MASENSANTASNAAAIADSFMLKLIVSVAPRINKTIAIRETTAIMT